MRPDKIDAHTEHRLQQNQRVNDSATLGDKFPRLKSLTVDLAYYNAENLMRSSQIKYTLNLATAKSVFRFDCPNKECVRGDFDLSEELTHAVAKGQKVVTGEMCCQGWLSKTTVNTARCRNILRYTLNLAYG